MKQRLDDNEAELKSTKAKNDYAIEAIRGWTAGELESLKHELKVK